MVFRIPCAFLLCLMQGETPWNPEILSHEPELNDSSGAFYACCALPGVGDVEGVWHSGMESLLKRRLVHVVGTVKTQSWGLSTGDGLSVFNGKLLQVWQFWSNLIKIVYSMTMHDSSWLLLLSIFELYAGMGWPFSLCQAQKCLGFPRWFLASQSHRLSWSMLLPSEETLLQHSSIIWPARVPPHFPWFLNFVDVQPEGTTFGSSGDWKLHVP